VLTHPTTGGVSASLAMLGDHQHCRTAGADRLRRPARDRTDRARNLPEGFQRSEFLLEKGAIDLIVDRRELRDPISADFMLKLGWAAGRAPGARRPRHRGDRQGHAHFRLHVRSRAGGRAGGGRRANVQCWGRCRRLRVAYLTRSLRADAGIVISASHNPHYDNGIKFFSAHGEKLDDATELAIEAALDAPFSTVPSEQLGKARGSTTRVRRYGEFCKSTGAGRVRPARAPACARLRTRRDLRHRAAPVHRAGRAGQRDRRRTRRTQHQPRASVPPISNALCARAREVAPISASPSMATATGVQMVDRDGRALDGDDLLYVLARWTGNEAAACAGPVVGTLMTNYGLEQALGEHGIPFRPRQGRRPLRAPDADRRPGRAGWRNLGTLAVPGSRKHRRRHRQRGAGAGSVAPPASSTCASCCKACTRCRSAPPTCASLPAASRMKPSRCRPNSKPAQAALQGRGRAFLRPSGTEPVVRITVEADDLALVQELLDRLRARSPPAA
jgi:phosphoglucosamine mutase